MAATNMDLNVSNMLTAMRKSGLKVLTKMFIKDSYNRIREGIFTNRKTCT